MTENEIQQAIKNCEETNPLYMAITLVVRAGYDGAASIIRQDELEQSKRSFWCGYAAALYELNDKINEYRN